MVILLNLSGQHPRSEKLVQATQDWERGRIRKADLKKAFKEDILSLIELQKKLGFEFISDGQMTIEWNDIFRPFTEHAKGLQKGPLVRWFNTNTFYYVPVIVDSLRTDGSILSKCVSKDALETGKAMIILPDPLTFVECSENRTGLNEEELMFSYSENILNPELKRLGSVGVKYVQFSSPSLVARPRQPPVKKERLSILGMSIDVALKGTNLRSGFYAHLGDASYYIPEIYDMIHTDCIGFDLTETDFRKIEPSERCFIAGIVNSRSSYVESVSSLVYAVEKLSEKFKDITLCPSSDLQYIPREYADMKLKTLQKVRRILNE